MQTHNKKVRKKRICAKIHIGNAKKHTLRLPAADFFPCPE